MHIFRAASLCVALSLCLTLPAQALEGQAAAPPAATIAATEFAQWRSAAGPEEVGGPYLNRLVFEQSPYLRQHASNPVNWHRWSDESLAVARQENRLIFLSIGYSTCHWCHVMNRESFSDPSMGSAINADFVAIKVDREESPLIDAHFSAILSAVTGSAGWPLTAVLLPDGSPIFIDAYLAPGALRSLLARTADLHKHAPESLRQSAAMLSSLTAVGGSVANKTSAPLTDDEFRELLGSVLAAMDASRGGLSGAQKFPNEALLHLLELASRRYPDSAAAGALELQLDAMARGGLHDVVHGGFFRYATDSLWQRPHFEKMLYNQALLLQSYSTRAQFTGSVEHQQTALSLRKFVVDWLSDDRGLFFSAISAESDDREGAFYTWDAAQIDALSHTDRVAAGLMTYAGPAESVGVYMQSPWDPAAQRLRHALNALHASAKRPFVDDKAIASWNAAQLSGLAALAAAQADASAHAIVLSANAESLWAHFYSATSNTLARLHYANGDTVPGQLEDYAFFMLACMDLFDLTRDPRWLVRGELLAQTIITRFVDENTLVAVDRDVRELAAPMRDRELPAADSVALRALFKLLRRRDAAELRRVLPGLVAPIRDRFREKPLQNAYAGLAVAEFDLGSVAPVQYFAGGHGRVALEQKPFSAFASRLTASGHSNERIRLDVSLDEGWHINAHEPFQSYLIATTAKAPGWATAYPTPVTRHLSFDDEPLSLYEGNIEIVLTREPESRSRRLERTHFIQINVQACSDRVCRPPEQLRFAISDALEERQNH